MTIEHIQGDKRELAIVVNDRRTGGVYDVSNLDIATLAIGPTDGVAVLFKTFDPIVVDGDPADGTIVVTLDPADTASIDPGRYNLQVRVLESDGDPFTVFHEQILIVKRITL